MARGEDKPGKVKQPVRHSADSNLMGDNDNAVHVQDAIP